MRGIGFGFAESGTVTQLAQEGNPKPRLFRLPEDEAVINRLGFNNRGVEVFLQNLDSLEKYGSLVVGVNIGKNKYQADPAADYVALLEKVHSRAHYVTINVSSPNTPGLRELQARNYLSELAARLAEKRKELAAEGRGKTPMLIKVAPDLSEEEQEDIAEIALGGFDGIIISNTTTGHREKLKNRHANETGGLSGRPLFGPSTAALGRFYGLTKGKIPLVGVGGVFSAADAYAKIKNGASLVQIYTSMIYKGPGVVNEIKEGLNVLLEKDGFSSVSRAVGVEAG